MSFQSIPTMENSDFYLDVAFRKAKKQSDKLRSTLKDDKITKSRKIELARIDAVRGVICDRLSHIVKEFPSLDGLSPFYRELVRVTLDYDDVKQSFGALNWAVTIVRDLSGKYSSKIGKAETSGKMNEHRRNYYGRVSSVLKKIDKNLKILIKARKVFVDYPVIKQMPTICITGFPNVGKTTLLSKLTGSTAEIKAYAFTTKRLNMGYKKKDKIQFIDTPGTLARTNKMNKIEMQAYIAMKHAADVIVYVWDVTDTYDLKDQEELFKRVKKLNKPIIEFVSKTDIADKAKVNALKKKRKSLVKTQAQLKKEIFNLANLID